MSGDQRGGEAWTFVEQHRDVLSVWARRLCVGTPLDHEDVLGEGVALLVTRWPRGGEAERSRFNEAIRALGDARRTLGRRHVRILRRECSQGLTDDLVRHTDRVDPTARAALDAVEAPPLADLLVGLTDAEREVMLVRSLGRTFSEIAVILGHTYDQVRGAFYRGRAKMEKALGPGEGSS